MIRKTIYLLLGSAIFLGGYELGRQPGSPDIIAHVQTGAQGLYAAGQATVGAIESAARTFGFVSETEETKQAEAASEDSKTAAEPTASLFESR
ncbi:MAG: hypothetical protein ACLFUJ_03745 [Phycisphaerae bacterium]